MELRMEFNEDGSIKPPQVLEEQKKEFKERLESGKIILIKRKQINDEKPAIAHLEIKIPSTYDNPRDILDYCASAVSNSKRFTDSLKLNLNFVKIDNYNCYIEIKSYKFMYRWLENFIVSFQEYFETTRTIVEGEWDKLDRSYYYQ